MLAGELVTELILVLIKSAVHPLQEALVLLIPVIVTTKEIIRSLGKTRVDYAGQKGTLSSLVKTMTIT